MLRRLGLTVALFIAGCATEPASPNSTAMSAEARRGAVLAQDVCAACHAVTDGDIASPNPSATPFETIANTPGMTAIALNAWLHTAHPTMPNIAVDQDQTDDLWAYLLTLRERN